MTTLTNLTLKIWRQDGPDAQGRFETHQIPEISDEASFLELLDILNERLIEEGKEAIVFDHDCREGICGTCSLMIDGRAHGPQKGTATCQVHMRVFDSGDEIVIEPWRAAAFPIIKDLMVDRSAFDRIIEVGGYITAPTGGAPDANLIPIPKPVADASMDAAACIGCGACVAACPNGAASLFTSAKLAHLNLLPQGQAERYKRAEAMVDKMDEYFGSCTNHGECQAACPKEISIDNIATMNVDYFKSKFKNRKSLARYAPPPRARRRRVYVAPWQTIRRSMRGTANPVERGSNTPITSTRCWHRSATRSSNVSNCVPDDAWSTWGAASVRPTLSIAAFVAPATVVGVDISEPMLAAARTRASATGLLRCGVPTSRRSRRTDGDRIVRCCVLAFRGDVLPGARPSLLPRPPSARRRWPTRLHLFPGTVRQSDDPAAGDGRSGPRRDAPAARTDRAWPVLAG